MKTRYLPRINFPRIYAGMYQIDVDGRCEGYITETRRGWYLSTAKAETRCTAKLRGRYKRLKHVRSHVRAHLYQRARDARRARAAALNPI